MKKILITQRLLQDSNTSEVRSALDIAWGNIFNQLGIVPITIAYDIDPLSYFLLDDIIGIFFTGGNDLNSIISNQLNKKRDDLETILLIEAMARQIPVVGICRGAEFIAHYFGGTLCQVAEHVTPLHSVELTSDTNFLRQFYPLQFSVNSYHNYAIVKLPSTLKAEATHKDGTIEAFIHKEKKIVGIMWHPERSPFMSETIKFLKYFLGIL